MARKEQRREKKIAAGNHDGYGCLIPQKTKFYMRNSDRITRIVVVNEKQKKAVHFAFLCVCASCDKEYRLSYQNESRRGRQCGRCSLIRDYFGNAPIFSDSLAKIKNRITRVETRECKGDVYNVFYVRCLYEGCEKDNRYISKRSAASSKKTDYCLKHWVIVVRLTAYKHIYNNMKASLKRGRYANKEIMSFEDFVKRCKETNCFYCGESVARSKYNNKLGNFKSSLDRKDPSRGYTFANTVTCCMFCNYTKGYLLTFYEMKIISLLRRHQVGEAVDRLRVLNWEKNSLLVKAVHQKIFERIHTKAKK